MVKVGIGVICIIFFAGLCWLYFHFQANSSRNELIFEENIKSVEDSLIIMDQLLQKFPTNTEIVNYFIDREGYIYLGAEKIAPLKGAIKNPKVRSDMFFENFTDNEITRFFSLITYLNLSYIDAASLEKQTGRFLFNYRQAEENTLKDIREIMILRSSSDTLTPSFKENFQKLDQKSNLVLFAPKKVK